MASPVRTKRGVDFAPAPPNLSGLLPLVNSLDDGDVAIQRQIGEALDCAAWLWPLHFQGIQFCTAANSQDDTRIVRGQKTASANLHATALEVARLEREARTDGIRI